MFSHWGLLEGLAARGCELVELPEVGTTEAARDKTDQDLTSHGGVLRPGQWCCEPLWLGVSRVHACECVASLRGLVVVRGTIDVGLGRTPLSPCVCVE